MNKRVLQINTVAVHGSTGRITEGIGSSAIEHGYESFIAYGRNKPSDSTSTLVRIGNTFSVNEHVIQTRLLDRQGLASKMATRSFVKEIIKINPDIIHLHNLHGNYINYKILFDYLSSSRKPVVWTIHDCWPITGHCVHFTAVNCDKWRTGCCNCPRLYSYPRSILFDRSRLNYLNKKASFTSISRMYLTPVSYWLGGVLAQSFLNMYPIKPIHNGIDLTSFYPRPESEEGIRRKYKLGNRFIVLGVATGWSSENGLYDFIQLREQLNDQFVIVLVGVTERIKALLPNGIVGIFRTDSQDELAELYSTADIFVNGSFEETFGLVTAEAMACGTPAIVYNSTACPEIVNPDVGYVIPVRDIVAMASTIKTQYALSKEERMAQSSRCTSYIMKFFRKEDRYAEYVSLYDRILLG